MAANIELPVLVADRLDVTAADELEVMGFEDEVIPLLEMVLSTCEIDIIWLEVEEILFRVDDIVLSGRLWVDDVGGAKVGEVGGAATVDVAATAEEQTTAYAIRTVGSTMVLKVEQVYSGCGQGLVVR